MDIALSRDEPAAHPMYVSVIVEWARRGKKPRPRCTADLERVPLSHVADCRSIPRSARVKRTVTTCTVALAVEKSSFFFYDVPRYIYVLLSWAGLDLHH